MRVLINSFIIIAIFYSLCTAQKKENLNPFSGIGNNALKNFRGINLALQGSAFISTCLLVTSGADYKFHNYFAERGYSPFFDPAVGAGYILPVVLPAGIYLYGEVKNLSREKAAGSAALQAMLISVVYSSFLKAITGRPGPDEGIYSDGAASEKFLFGFLRGGIHYGWPSGHLCTNTAIVSSLMSFYHDNSAVKIGGLLYLGYLFYGVAAHDNNTMHWLSDIVAGTIIGYTIGTTTGKYFHDEWQKNTTPLAVSQSNQNMSLLRLTLNTGNTIYTFLPAISSGYRGICMNVSF